MWSTTELRRTLLSGLLLYLGKFWIEAVIKRTTKCTFPRSVGQGARFGPFQYRSVQYWLGVFAFILWLDWQASQTKSRKLQTQTKDESAYPLNSLQRLRGFVVFCLRSRFY